MNIEVTFDQNVNFLPSGFVSAVNYAVNYLDTLFTNPVTINLDVGYGEIAGTPLAPGDLGESYAPYVQESYSAVVNALQQQGAPGSYSLPATAPLSGTLYMTVPEAEALGLYSGVATCYVGFSSFAPFSYTPNVTPPAGEYYFVGLVEHEITEDMGRVSLINEQPYGYSPMDLFRYSAPGVRDLTASFHNSTAYFSLDGGNTNLGSWNNDVFNGDLGDWYGNNIPNNGNDAFNDYSNSGVLNAFSNSDLLLMEAIGWTTTPASANVQNVVLSENATIPASSLITSLNNPRGDAIGAYGFLDTGTSGYFTVDGTPQSDGQWFYVDPSDLSSVQYVAGSAPGSDTIYVELFDATTQTWSDTSTLTATITTPPVLFVSNIVTGVNAAVPVSSFAALSNPGNDDITQYQFYDYGLTRGGYIAVNGVPQPTAQWITVNSSDLNEVQYVGGQRLSVQFLAVEAYDATLGEWLPPSSWVVAVTIPGVGAMASLASMQPQSLGYAADGGGASGALTGDMAHMANIALLAQHMASSFASAGDAHGSHLIADPSIVSQFQLAHPHA
jgi:hypothetical protein